MRDAVREALAQSREKWPPPPTVTPVPAASIEQPPTHLPSRTEITNEPINVQLEKLLDECRLSVNEKLAEALGIETRSIFRHLSVNDTDKENVARYEKFFSERLRMTVRLNVSKKPSKRSIRQ